MFSTEIIKQLTISYYTRERHLQKRNGKTEQTEQKKPKATITSTINTIVTDDVLTRKGPDVVGHPRGVQAAVTQHTHTHTRAPAHTDKRTRTLTRTTSTREGRPSSPGLAARPGRGLPGR